MIYDLDTAAVLAKAPVTASAPWTRLRGMIGRSFTEKMDAMIFPDCNAVHTFFMGIPLDVLFLDRSGRVVKTVCSLPPWRLYAGTVKAADTVEFPAGTLDGVKIGHRILLDRVPEKGVATEHGTGGAGK